MGDRETQYQMIRSMLVAGIPQGVPKENYLRDALAALRTIAPALSDDDFDRVFDDVSKVMSISMDLGVVIEAKDHRSWLPGRRGDIDWRLWSAYLQWQSQQGRSPVILDVLDRSLDVILDHMGDPADQGSWNQRGLVIGEVQSGKTGTYLGLIDKAADAGYRVFILLTGNTESLRQQTQSRVDQGVIGRDSLSQTRSNVELTNKPKAVGIGKLLETTSSAFSMTTMTTDFRKNSVQAVDISPGPDNLVVFVTKKNKTVLDRIAEWLEQQDNVAGKIKLPLLLIDDEADYASINTRNVDESPTAINQGIRRLLSLFSRSSYVGFTATPFANIFIDDEQDDDLFPKDFIYGLEAPSNYVGPRALFGAERSLTDDDPWHEIDDANAYFPVSHKSYLQVDGLPDSLHEALRVFVVANAIRDMRNDDSEPRAMLINVSRYNNVQSQVYDLVTAELAMYRSAIQLHATAYAEGRPNRTIDLLKAAFDSNYSECEFDWNQVVRLLPSSVADVQTRLVNSKTDKKLEQDELSTEAPPRVVAIGGDLLSRGLTLDGLMVSYFYRHSAAADTLMQMGRWFGYREGYGDLCRLWIDPEMAAAYAHAADSLDELRLELKRMRDQKLTPQQYGIAVRTHPGALLITARNKMRAAAQGKKQISLRGRSIESYRLPSGAALIKENFEAAEDLIAALQREQGQPSREKPNRPAWLGVNKRLVADFLGRFRAHASSELFQAGALERFVRTAIADDLQEWDVVLVEGRGDKRSIAGIEYAPPARAVAKNSNDAWLVSGRRQRVAGPGDVSGPLTAASIRKVKEQFRSAPGNEGKQSVPDTEYVYALARPLLLLYLLDPTVDGRQFSAVPFTAVVLAIPGLRDESGARDERDDVVYTLNSVAQRLWMPELADTSIEDESNV